MTDFNEIYRTFVPASGHADTVGGELLRALQTICGEFDGEGERLGCSDYAEAYVNPAGRYVYRIIDDPQIRSILDKCWGKDAFSMIRKYNQRLDTLSALICVWIEKHPEIFKTPNTGFFEDEENCPLDAKNVEGFDFSRDYGKSLNKSKSRHRK